VILTRLPPRADCTPKPGLGSALARGLLRALGWRLVFDGFPARQGVVLVYPHTSNWDFPLGVLVKWATGLQPRWWGKDSLFRIPLLKHWLRWIGGMPVDRSNRHGIVGQTAEELRAAKARGEDFWLAAAPEGTRSLTPGWRSGAYQVAVQAQAPIALVGFDFGRRTVWVKDFVLPSGDAERDFACFAEVFKDVRGYRHDMASPIKLRS
jgi:1-acyl-sn-glycerol-3-phosphate acyltransferase